MKVIVLTRRSLLTGLLFVCLGVSVLVLTLMWVPKAAAAFSQNRLVPIYRVDRTDKTISISFDAAWGNEDTQRLIDILNSHHVHATFFVVGQWVDKYPESVLALSKAGNEVMNHSNTHPHMPKLSAAEMLAEITACDNKVKAVTGTQPILFRPPYGDYNNTLIQALGESNHYAIQWDVDSLDWKGIGASQITQNVLSKVKSGSIVLFHNAALHTPEALPGILDSLQKQGYKIVPISQLIYKQNYTIDRAGTQHLNSPASSGLGAASSAVSGSSAS